MSHSVENSKWPPHETSKFKFYHSKRNNVTQYGVQNKFVRQATPGLCYEIDSIHGERKKPSYHQKFKMAAIRNVEKIHLISK